MVQAIVGVEFTEPAVDDIFPIGAVAISTIDACVVRDMRMSVDEVCRYFAPPGVCRNIKVPASSFEATPQKKFLLWWQDVPLTTPAVQIQQGVHYLAEIDFPGSTARLGRRQKQGQELPLRIGEVGRIVAEAIQDRQVEFRDVGFHTGLEGNPKKEFEEGFPSSNGVVLRILKSVNSGKTLLIRQ